MVEGELKCKKCGAILNDFNCDELYDLHEKNIDVDNSTELMCNDCALEKMPENTFRSLYVMMKVLNLMSVCLFHSSVLWENIR